MSGLERGEDRRDQREPSYRLHEDRGCRAPHEPSNREFRTAPTRRRSSGASRLSSKAALARQRGGRKGRWRVLGRYSSADSYGLD